MTLSRRHFMQAASVAGLGLLAGCGRLPGETHAPPKMPRIGFLWLGPRAAIQDRVDAFLQGLQQYGYVEGQSIAIEWRFADGQVDQLPALAGELVQLPVDVIVVPGVITARAAKQVTSTIPIVITVVNDPVGTGLVASLAQPGGNATGLSSISADLVPKRLELLREAVPGIARVVAVSGAGQGNDAVLAELQDAARALGLQIEFVAISDPDDLRRALGAADNNRAQALQVLEDPVTITYRTEIVGIAAASRLPVIYESKQFVEAGGLMAYGPNRFELYRRAGYYVDRILKGAKPADLPVEQPTTFDFVINLQTAQALGLTIPQHVLLQATELIQ
jgi:putative ABC transport system substrate-binding protein